jgi:putative Mg2+ transporter-C (MgtC) family protein
MFNQIFDIQFLLFIGKISLAMLLGLLLGLERIYAHKTAGMRTYALVAAASAGFVAVSLYIGATFTQFTNAFNPAFMAGYVILGIGFLGAGVILHKDGHVENLTTAAGIWACSGIGMMVGFGMFREAVFMSLLIFFVLGVLSFVERMLRLTFFPDPVFEETEAVPIKKVRVSRKKISEDSN